MCESCKRNEDYEENTAPKEDSYIYDNKEIMKREKKMNKILEVFDTNAKAERKININYSSFCDEKNKNDYINEDDLDKISNIDKD